MHAGSGKDEGGMNIVNAGSLEQPRGRVGHGNGLVPDADAAVAQGVFMRCGLLCKWLWCKLLHVGIAEQRYEKT
eukprot:1759343-Amphidinium_carterae.2